MAPTTNADTELLTEHFGYPPVSLLDDIINSINILAERALNSVEQGLLSQPPASLGFRTNPSSKSTKNSITTTTTTATSDDPEDAHRHEVENGTHQLETLLCASIDRNFDKFELYVMRNILCVRPEDRDWIRLAHYEGLDFSSSYNDDNDTTSHPTVESVTSLRRRLQASQQLNCMLHNEKERLGGLLSELRAQVGSPERIGVKSEPAEDDGAERPASSADRPPLAFLLDKGDLRSADTEKPLTVTTAFTLSQMPALRALSTSLRNLTPDLVDKDDDDDGGGGGDADGIRKGWRRQRREYIEQATRKHLENVRGLELGKNGEVRDGEWQGEGGNAGSGEVENLERLVDMLGDGADADCGAVQSSAAGGDEMDTS